MLFNSLEFAVFLPVVFFLYLVLQHHGRNRMLLVASYFFYGWWDWRFLGLLFLTSTIDFGIGLAMASASTPSRRKMLLAGSVAVNLGILGFFKYFNFFAGSLSRLLAAVGLPIPEGHLALILPVGISFYTFQSMSYTIDVYRRRLPAARSYWDFLLYVSFFPQLVAGPIERADHLLPQVQRPRTVTWDGAREGCWLLLWGLFKKIYVADNLAKIADRVYSQGTDPTAGETLMATYAFAFQIYGDFSGYSDMARGLGRMMGFDIMQNFRFPYFAVSPSDFWRRWHISLSTWLRDYLYIPLGGNRNGKAREHRNLWITMFLGGLWHGAAWHFVLWGAFHAALLSLQRLLTRPLSSASRGNPPAGGRAGVRVLKMILFFHVTCLGWMIFRAESLTHLGRLLGSFGRGGWMTGDSLNATGKLLLYSTPLLLIDALDTLRPSRHPIMSLPPFARGIAYGTLVYLILLLGAIFQKSFIYFQF